MVAIREALFVELHLERCGPRRGIVTAGCRLAGRSDPQMVDGETGWDDSVQGERRTSTGTERSNRSIRSALATPELTGEQQDDGEDLQPADDHQE